MARGPEDADQDGVADEDGDAEGDAEDLAQPAPAGRRVWSDSHPERSEGSFNETSDRDLCADDSPADPSHPLGMTPLQHPLGMTTALPPYRPPRPESLAAFTFYYAWIRFKTNVGGTFGQFQVAAQIGERFGGACFNSTWCTLTSLETVRVLPWMCGFMGPNDLYFNNLWKRWRYDLAGFKNEQCA